jgi:hypothetical protein
MKITNGNSVMFLKENLDALASFIASSFKANDLVEIEIELDHTDMDGFVTKGDNTILQNEDTMKQWFMLHNVIVSVPSLGTKEFIHWPYTKQVRYSAIVI